eukprot:scaffold24407_cov67-Isochrysis_galbana.AAC.1
MSLASDSATLLGSENSVWPFRSISNTSTSRRIATRWRQMAGLDSTVNCSRSAARALASPAFSRFLSRGGEGSPAAASAAVAAEKKEDTVADFE